MPKNKRPPPYILSLTGDEKGFLRKYRFDFTLACIFENKDGLFENTLWPQYQLEFGSREDSAKASYKKVRYLIAIGTYQALMLHLLRSAEVLQISPLG